MLKGVESEAPDHSQSSICLHLPPLFQQGRLYKALEQSSRLLMRNLLPFPEPGSARVGLRSLIREEDTYSKPHPHA